MRKRLLTILTITLSCMVVILSGALVFSFSKQNTNLNGFPTDSQQPAVQMIPTAFMTPVSDDDFVNAAEKTVNAVVHIRTEIIQRSNSYDDFFGYLLEQLYGRGSVQIPENKVIGLGSGVVISGDGYIVTNNHVVEGAEKIEVTFNDNRKRVATIVGTDPKTDLALIKVDGTDLEYLVFGDSDKVRVGEWVLAVGNPFELNSTVTAGIVSAKARNINILGDNGTIESFIQTDAVVNRGNSGGALVDTQGRLIGINAAIASHTGVYEGYSFAIPSNIVKKVVQDFMKYGSTQRAYIGVEMAAMTEEFAASKHIDMVQGVYVASVQEKGGAKKAGIKEGDIIIEANGLKINTTSELLGIIIQFNPGDKIKLGINRDGQVMEKEVELTDSFGATGYDVGAERFMNDRLGVVLEQLSAKDKKDYDVQGGLKVVEVKGGIFERGGVNEGFVITRINGQTVTTKENLEAALNKSLRGKTSVEGVYANGMRISFEYYD